MTGSRYHFNKTDWRVRNSLDKPSGPFDWMKSPRFRLCAIHKACKSADVTVVLGAKVILHTCWLRVPRRTYLPSFFCVL